jgi:hypothetical protein
MLDLDAFMADGYIKVEQAASRSAADAARTVLWRQLGLSPDDPERWSAPVRWASDMTGEGPFGELVRSPALAAALDQICGTGGWLPRGSLGNIPVRFPVFPPDYDRGWHIDANTPQSDGSWTVTGHPHTVLLLTVLSEVGVTDAPTRIRAGWCSGRTRSTWPRWVAWSTTPAPGGPSCTPPGNLATCTSSTRSRCTPRTSTGAARRGSWRSRRSC